MLSRTENYGILRDAIQVAAELSDFLGQRSDVCWLAHTNVPFGRMPRSPALSNLPLMANRRTIAFYFGRPFRRGARVARSSFAFGTWPNVARRLRLRVDWLALRIADCLGQHPVQVSLRGGGLRHLVAISLSTSRFPWPSAQPSIGDNFSRRLPAVSRILLMPPVCRRSETRSRGLVVLGPSLFYCS
jgi:hypothetical protein